MTMQPHNNNNMGNQISKEQGFCWQNVEKKEQI